MLCHSGVHPTCEHQQVLWDRLVGNLDVRGKMSKVAKFFCESCLAWLVVRGFFTFQEMNSYVLSYNWKTNRFFVWKPFTWNIALSQSLFPLSSSFQLIWDATVSLKVKRAPSVWITCIILHMSSTGTNPHGSLRSALFEISLAHPIQTYFKTYYTISILISRGVNILSCCIRVEPSKSQFSKQTSSLFAGPFCLLGRTKSWTFQISLVFRQTLCFWMVRKSFHYISGSSCTIEIMFCYRSLKKWTAVFSRVTFTRSPFPFPG